jgi:hypothetical protein
LDTFLKNLKKHKLETRAEQDHRKIFQPVTAVREEDEEPATDPWIPVLKQNIT